MKIYLGADHRGFKLKEKVKEWLSDWNYKYEDMGANDYNETDDYPDFAKAVSEKIVSDDGSRGILICGSGIGIAIAANKVKGVRAGTAMNADQVKASVNDEDLNILALSVDYTREPEA